MLQNSSLAFLLDDSKEEEASLQVDDVNEKEEKAEALLDKVLDNYSAEEENKDPASVNEVDNDSAPLETVMTPVETNNEEVKEPALEEIKDPVSVTTPVETNNEEVKVPALEENKDPASVNEVDYDSASVMTPVETNNEEVKEPALEENKTPALTEQSIDVLPVEDADTEDKILPDVDAELVESKAYEES